MHPFTRFTRSVAGGSALLLYLPPVLLTGWAGIYLYEVFEFVTAPGISVNFEYESIEGKVKISASSYSIDAGSQVLRAKGVNVTAPDGRNVLVAQELVVSRDQTGLILVQARGADAMIDRLPNGNMSFFALQPKPTEEKGADQPMDIMVRGARVVYRDLTGGTQLKLVAKTNDLRVTGSGVSWLVNGTLHLSDVGIVPIQMVTGADNGTQTTVTLSNSKLFPIINHILRWIPEASEIPFTAKSLIGSGRLVIDATPKQAVKVFGSLKGSAQGMVINGLRDTVALYDFKFSGERGDGLLKAKSPAIQGDATVAMSWKKDFRVVSGVKVNAPNLRSLPREWLKTLPKDLDLRNAVYTGIFGFSQDKWASEGRLKSNLSWAKDRFGETEARIIADNRQIIIEPDRLTWNGTRLRGAGRIDLQMNEVLAFVESQRGNLSPLLRKFGVSATANGTVIAQISGRLSKPIVQLGAQGTGSYTLESGKSFAGKFDVVGSGDLSKIKLSRAVIRGKQGTISATGDIAFSSNQLSLDVLGAGISPSLIADNATGSAYLKGKLSGSPSNPNFVSEIDLYGTEIGDSVIPLVTLQAKGNLSKIDLSEIYGNTGFSQLRGEIGLNLKSKTLSGTFTAPQIQLADFADAGVAGRLRVDQGRIFGTLEKPQVEASFTGGPLALSGVSLDQVTGKLRTNGDLLSLDQTRALVKRGDQTGQIDLSGSYAMKSEQGTLVANWTDLPLSPVSQFDPRFSFGGQASGSAKLAFLKGKVRDGEVESSFNNLALNGQEIGFGSANFKSKNGNWSGTGRVGTIDNYVLVDQLNYKEDGKIQGVLAILDLKSDTLQRIAAPLLQERNPELKNTIAKIGATMGGTIAFNFDGTDLNLTQFDAEIRDIRYSGRNLGTGTEDGITAKLTKEKSTWNLADFKWRMDSQSLEGKGSFQENGAILGSLSANKIDLNLISLLEPKAPLIPATLDGVFEFKNTIDNPEIAGSTLLTGTGTDPDRPTLDLYAVSLRDKVLSAAGQFRASGFTGMTTLTGPMTAFSPTTIDRQPGDEFNFFANLSPRKLSEFDDLLSFVDLTKSFGTIGGQVTAKGNIDLYSLAGNIRLLPETGKPDQLVFKDASTYLKSPRLGVRFEDNRFIVDGQGDSSAGGSVAFSASTPFKIPEKNDLQSILKQFPLEGQISLNDFRIIEGDFAKKNRIEGSTKSLSGTDLPYLSLGGTLYEPEIVGTLYTQGLNLDLPTFGPQAAGPPPPVNPKFRIQAFSKDPVVVRTTNASLIANATASIGGSLLFPEVSGALILKDGFLRLPNARISLEEGGTVNLTYRSQNNREAFLEAPVNLIGRTSISARRGAASYERYDITMFVRGDLLKDGALKIDAQSEPPDLSSNEIMAIIGQRDLIESFAGYGTTGNNQQLRNAVLGLVVPSLSDWITTPLAQSFKLDYLAVDYNGIEGATIFGAKSLNRYVSIQGRRGIGPSSPFSKTIFELKLIYRIPSRNINLSRARFSIGTDTYRPWRITVEYSFKL